MGTVVGTSRQVLFEGAPVAIILHQYDGTWQMVCSTPGKSDDDMAAVHFGDLVDSDSTLTHAIGLRPGQGLFRTDRSSGWRVIYFSSDDEISELF